MKSRVGVVFVLAATFALAAAAGEKKPAAVLTPTAEVKWADVPDAPGVKIAPVDGDPSKGASHFYLKFPAGFSAPLHLHTADHFGTVVSGTMDLTVDGKETSLPAGSYWSFKGKTKHSTKCTAAAECVLFIDARGKWDVVGEPAPKADAPKAPAADAPKTK